MLFRNKKPLARIERRRQYRIPQSKKHPLSATLKQGQTSLQAEFIDVSVHGVGLKVAAERGDKMELGDVVELTVMSFSHGKVTTPGKLVHKESDGKFVRVGFEFVNVGDLYAQLDAFYSRIFNRRRSVRVRPELDRKLTVVMRWAGKELKATVTNVSDTGLGIVLPVDSANELENVDKVAIQFKLPGATEPLHGAASVRNKSTVSGQFLCGLMFDFDQQSSLATRRSEIGAYVEKRAEEIAKWESSWGEPMKAKSGGR
jgi:c-di-GMP-binding flagellar brake protein YcgR